MTDNTYDNRLSIQQLCDDARAQALDVARNSNALHLLVTASEWRAALWVAEELYWEVIKFNGGGAYWNRQTYGLMVEAVREAVG